MTRPTHINPNCHCGAPLRPRVEVFANADADEWVCSAGCTDGVFFDWTEAQLAVLHLDDASLDRAWEGALAEIRAEGGDPDAMVARAADTLAYYRANPAPSTHDPLATICADIACNTEHRAPRGRARQRRVALPCVRDALARDRHRARVARGVHPRPRTQPPEGQPMSFYQALARQQDGRFDYTCTNSAGVFAVGFCGGGEGDGLHLDGHATAAEAYACYRRFQLAHETVRGERKDTQRKCRVCGDWTTHEVVVGNECPTTYAVCVTHDTPDHMLALHGAKDPA